MSSAVAKAAELSSEDRQRMMFRAAMARKKRKDRESEGEITELNLTAMMDMMTIILVFLLKSFSASTVAMSTSEDVRPPLSTTRAPPRDTIAVTVTPKHIMVGDKSVIELANGQIPGDALQGRLVVPLDQRLKKEVEKLKTIESRGGTQFSRELSVIGDRKVPYDLLLTVLYTAGQNELENYRFVVLQKEGGDE
jgi:biopolymer transport protein ExbD